MDSRTPTQAEEFRQRLRDVETAVRAEYNRMSAQSAEIQRQAIEANRRYRRVVRPALLLGGVAVVALLAYVLWLGRAYIG